MTVRNRFGTKLSTALGVLAVTLGAMGIAVAGVRADPVGPQTCGASGSATTCLMINWADAWKVHVGIDVPMPRAEAELLMECSGGRPFWAELWGEDGNDDKDDYRMTLPLSPGWPAVGDAGIGAEFGAEVDASTLHEDSSDEHPDEIYVRIYMLDCRGERTVVRRYNTKTIEHAF